MKKLLWLLLLTGCLRVGPNYKDPAVDTQDSWLPEKHVDASLEAEINGWWKNYNDETLNALVDYALAENYNLEAAAYAILAARANLGFAIGQYFPQTQQIEGSAFRNHISANAPNTFGIDRDFWDNILGLRIAWEIDIWGRFFRGVQAAYGEYAATEDDYRDMQRILISDVVLDYVQLRTLQKRIDVLDSNIKIQKRSVDIAKVRWQEGYDSELDYAQAVSLWKETMAQKTTLEIELKQMMTSLAILLGLTPEEFIREEFIICFPIGKEPLYVPTDAEINFPAELLGNRPDLARSRDLLFAQTANVGVAIANLFPHISFTGFLGLECASGTHSTANQMGKHFFSRKSLTFFYGPTMTWPVLDYGRLENVVREQYAILNQGIAAYRNQVLGAFKEVEDALTSYAKSIEETENLQDSYKYAKRSVDISILQYQEGLADYSRVLNSLQLQVAAEDSLAQAEGNIGLAYASIFTALGGGIPTCGD